MSKSTVYINKNIKLQYFCSASDTKCSLAHEMFAATLAHSELKRKGVKDPHLEVEPGQEPKFSSHSLRRLADTVARRDMSITGTSEAEIDIYFGWQEKILLKAMQRHYEAMSVFSRMLKAKITSWM